MTFSWMMGVGSTGRRSAASHVSKPTPGSLLHRNFADETRGEKGNLTFFSHSTHSRLDRLLTHRHFVFAEDAIVVRGEVARADFGAREYFGMRENGGRDAGSGGWGKRWQVSLGRIGQRGRYGLVCLDRRPRSGRIGVGVRGRAGQGRRRDGRGRQVAHRAMWWRTSSGVTFGPVLRSRGDGCRVVPSKAIGGMSSGVRWARRVRWRRQTGR